jgi:hypothetical protein
MADLIEPPKPQGLLGLNSVVTYGENLQVAMPLNHQLAVGSNLQLCINPLGLAAGVPGFPASAVASGFLGGGIGGNMQFTIGTSANVVLGRSYTINMGPTAISVDLDDPFAYTLCGIIGGAATLWVLVYGLTGDDTKRANWGILFQALIDVALGALMIYACTKKQGQMAADRARGEMFGTDWVDKAKQIPITAAGIDNWFEVLNVAAAIAGVAILPPVLIATNENFKAS